MRLCFPRPPRTFLNSPSLTNINIALIYPFTISEQETKDCVPSGNFQHKLQHCFCFSLMFSAFHIQSYSCVSRLRISLTLGLGYLSPLDSSTKTTTRAKFSQH